MAEIVEDALVNLAPGAQWRMVGDTLEWKDSKIAQPTQAKIDAEVKRLQAIWDAQEYARNRYWEYKKLNQFELMTDDAENSTTTHADAIAVIKTKWPKDNSGPVE